MSMLERIQAGEFKPTIDYPVQPKTPAILKRQVSDLTDLEIATITQLRADHTAALAVYSGNLKTYREQDSDGYTRFRIALAEDNGVTGHPKEGMLYAKAWEMGHSNGLSEVANVYEDLVELIR